jgi:non-heme chloroperoxidase
LREKPKPILTAAAQKRSHMPTRLSANQGDSTMPTITTKDGVEIFYKDWGSGQPIVFSHGWPLSADDWDAQMLFFQAQGFRVIAHDRRGHGRSSQTGGGHDMDHYADDLAALTAHLDLKGAVHVGHSTGGGEVVHYIARHGESRVAKAAILSAVPPFDGKDGGQSRWAAKGGVRRIAGAIGRQPRAILLRSPGGTFLWFQPAGREGFARHDLELVAPGHDGWRQGAL